MSVWTVRLLTDSTEVYSFPAMPFVTPELKPEWSTAEPSLVTALTKTHTIEGILYGNERSTGTAWATLVAALAVSGSSQINGVELRRDGTVVDSIKIADGWKALRWDDLRAAKSDGQWRGELRFSLKISGRKRFAIAGYPDPSVSAFDARLSWAYSEAGLLTQTYEGTLETADGTSAVAVARLCGLDLPDSTYGWVTKGPEGVDVERLDEADSRASFRSIVRGTGDALPSGVGPSFTVLTEETTVDGETTTTVTVTASGIGAEDAVRAQIPPGSLASSKISTDNQRNARGVFVSKGTDDDPVASATKTHRFKIRGGGRPILWSERTGGRAPVRHYGSFKPSEITETIVLEQSGADGANFTVPAPLDGVEQDYNASEPGVAERIVRGADPSGDRWRLEITRVYRASDSVIAFLQAFASSLAGGPGGATSFPYREIADQGEGLP